MDNSILNASGHSPADKIELHIHFALSHARLYLTESDDERDNKSDAEKNSIYAMVVEDLALHYQPSLSIYWLLPL